MCSIIGVRERLHKGFGQIDLGTLDSGERSLPFGLLVSVPDNNSNSVTVMDADGTVYCQYTDPDLQSPGGLCFDTRSIIIVCGSGSNNLQIVSLFGEKLKTIFTLQET